MRELGQELVDDPELRALVVIGDGRAFSSGIDTTVFTGGGGDAIEDGDDAGTRHADPTVDGIMRTQESYSWLENARVPDDRRGARLRARRRPAARARVRHPRVRPRREVGLLEHKYGILPDLGGTQRLPRVVGPGKAKEMILTAARIDADESYRIGLCEQLVDDEELETGSSALAATIAAQPPLAVQGAKRAVRPPAGCRWPKGWSSRPRRRPMCLRSNDMREAITAFIEQRDPKYEGK